MQGLLSCGRYTDGNPFYFAYMKMKFRYFIAVIIACFSLFVFDVKADNVNLPVVELLGKDYYVYKVKGGDSLFGIARRFGWDDKVLRELNPSVISPLKKGAKIYYPAEEKSVKSDNRKTPLKSADPVNHLVKRGETVYAIANMYGVSVDRIYKLNPSSKNGIKAGETLIIRQTEPAGKLDNSSNPVFYTVRKGDTLYGVSKAYNVSVAALMKSNPGVDENNFQEGSTIKIPVKGSGIETTVKEVDKSSVDAVVLHKATKNENWNSIASDNNVSVDLLKEANPEVKEVRKNSIIAVPKVETVTEQLVVAAEDPRESAPGGIQDIYEDVHKIADKEDKYTVRVAVVPESVSSKKDMEYLRGFLTGIDRQKHAGYNIDFKVVDATKGSEAVITELDEYKPTVVFVTGDNDIPSYISEYASVSLTPVVNAFDVKSMEYTSNPYIFQLLAPSNLFNESVAAYINGKYGTRKLIFVGDIDENDMLAEFLRNEWKSGQIANISPAMLTPDYFTDEGHYLIYCNPIKKNEVSAILDDIIKVKEEHPLADIDVIGRPNIIVYDEAMEKSFHRASVKIPARFYVDRESSEYKQFANRYKSLFNRVPQKAVPMYAAVGYDNAIYFIPEIARHRGDFNKLGRSSSTVQNNYDPVRVSNWGGFLNPPVFLIEFTTFDTIEKTVIGFEE